MSDMFRYSKMVLGGLAHGLCLDTKISGAKAQLYPGKVRATMNSGQRIGEWEREIALTEYTLEHGGVEAVHQLEATQMTGLPPVQNVKALGPTQPTFSSADLMAEMRAARQDTKDLKSNMVTKKDLANQRAYMDANFQRKKGRPRKAPYDK